MVMFICGGSSGAKPNVCSFMVFVVTSGRKYDSSVNSNDRITMVTCGKYDGSSGSCNGYVFRGVSKENL